jgi:hypothetical protein
MNTIYSFLKLNRHIRSTRVKLFGIYKVLDIAKTVTTLKIRLPETGEILSKTMLLTKKHKSIACLFDRG